MAGPRSAWTSSRSNANLVNVSRQVLAEIEKREASRRSCAGMQVLVIDNQAESVTDSLTELIEAGAIGRCCRCWCCISSCATGLSTLMVTLAIPICFVMTLGFMYFLGITLNILSMMGLLLAVGMLVDNAVVVVESIYQ